MQPSERLIASGSDATVVRLMLERDSRGLHMLLERHGGHVRKGIAKSLGTMLATTELDEAMNTATFNAWRSVDTFDAEKGTLRAWFYVIARNAARELMRTRQRLALEPRGEEMENLAAPSTDDDTSRGEGTCDEDAARSPFLQALHACIDALPRMQKHIIQADLRCGDVADAGELATALKTSKNSVYVSRSNARKALRRALLARGFGAQDPQSNDTTQS